MWEYSKQVRCSDNVEWYEFICQRCYKSLDTWWRFGFTNSEMSSGTYEKPELGSHEPLKKKVKDGGSKMGG
jgi:hypothetical protein